MDEKFFRNADFALGNVVDRNLQQPPNFGGKPGEPVPVVDPEDVKALWKMGRDAQGNGCGAVGVEVMRHACKPGAKIEAVWYRAALLWLITQIGPEPIAQFMREGQPNDSVFPAAAKVPAEWMGAEVRRSPPFDVNEFLRFCGEGDKT